MSDRYFIFWNINNKLQEKKTKTTKHTCYTTTAMFLCWCISSFHTFCSVTYKVFTFFVYIFQTIWTSPINQRISYNSIEKRLSYWSVSKICRTLLNASLSSIIHEFSLYTYKRDTAVIHDDQVLICNSVCSPHKTFYEQFSRSGPFNFLFIIAYIF